MLLAAKSGYHTADAILIVADCGHEAWMTQTQVPPDTITVCFNCVDLHAKLTK